MAPFEELADGIRAIRDLAQRVQDLGVQVSKILGQLGGKTIRSGTTVVATSSSTTGSTAVPHGLGTTPTEAFATAKGTAGVVNAEIDSFDATNVVIRVGYTDGTPRSQSNTVYWLAVA